VCVAILCKAGAIIPETSLRACFTANPDGAGFAYVHPDTNKIVVKKGYFDFDKFKKDYYPAAAKYGQQSPFVVHMRIATSGRVDKSNCHPFKVRGGVMAHNGVMGAGFKEKSDTRVFVELYQNALRRDWVEANKDKIGSAVGSWNKLVFLFEDRSFVIINEKAWHWKNGIAYSNTSWEWRERGTSYNYHGYGRGSDV